MEAIVLYRCGICGTVVDMLHNGEGTVVCCGQPMDRLEPAAEGPAADHRPAVTVEGDRVTVSAAPGHPMTDSHRIEWIALTEPGMVQRARLLPGQPPRATFLAAAPPLAAYVFCSQHGLYETDLTQK